MKPPLFRQPDASHQCLMVSTEFSTEWRSIMMMGFGGLGMVFMLVFWVVIAGLAMWLLAELFPQMRTNPSGQTESCHDRRSNTVLDILEKRYARGEITRTQYEEMRDHMQL